VYAVRKFGEKSAFLWLLWMLLRFIVQADIFKTLLSRRRLSAETPFSKGAARVARETCRVKALARR
jgi:hypothetical protein